ncbi:hypothetical protein GY45DRAFT_494164 [Cubamyces sp. BRFM 1775]|nr:hypothetical protein GY45DRAFT_494164 [Cubamyces sp. BRFM 1775]
MAYGDPCQGSKSHRGPPSFYSTDRVFFCVLSQHRRKIQVIPKDPIRVYGTSGIPASSGSGAEPERPVARHPSPAALRTHPTYVRAPCASACGRAEWFWKRAKRCQRMHALYGERCRLDPGMVRRFRWPPCRRTAYYWGEPWRPVININAPAFILGFRLRDVWADVGRGWETQRIWSAERRCVSYATSTSSYEPLSLFRSLNALGYLRSTLDVYASCYQTTDRRISISTNINE